LAQVDVRGLAAHVLDMAVGQSHTCAIFTAARSSAGSKQCAVFVAPPFSRATRNVDDGTAILHRYDVAFFATTTLMLALVPHTVKSK